MAFRQTGLCRLITLVLTLCMLACAAEIIAGVKDVLSTLSDGVDGEKSEARARIEQVGSRLTSLEATVKLVINALGIDTVSRLADPEEE